jgi:hypothetical protein
MLYVPKDDFMMFYPEGWTVKEGCHIGRSTGTCFYNDKSAKASSMRLSVRRDSLPRNTSLKDLTRWEWQSSTVRPRSAKWAQVAGQRGTLITTRLTRRATVLDAMTIVDGDAFIMLWGSIGVDPKESLAMLEKFSAHVQLTSLPDPSIGP